MSTTTAAGAGAPGVPYRSARFVRPACSNSADLVNLGQTRPTLQNVPQQFRRLQQLAGPTASAGDAARASANLFRDAWAKALNDNPDGPEDPNYDHSKFLDPDYLKSIEYDGHKLVVPGDAKASYLPQMIGGANGAYEMPPEGGMKDADRAALVSLANDWITQKAVNWDPLPPPHHS